MHRFILLSVFLLTACSTVGWGGEYEITRSDTRAVHIKYDRMVIGREKIDFIAADQCGRHNKKAVASGLLSHDEYGYLLTQRYRCERL